PAGSEPTGMTFSPDNKFMFVSIQHPSGSNTTEMIDASGTPIIFNKETAIVIARKEFLGVDALELIAQCTPTLNVTSNFQEPICFGEEVDFTANSINAGVNATYEWKLNGNNVGSDATYSSNSLLD